MDSGGSTSPGSFAIPGARAGEAPVPPGATSRFVYLDGLRGLAALAIVIHHFTALSGHRELFASAYIAVDFFFCLSGFVIALAYHERLRHGMTLADYARRRLIRLYPMYLLGTIFGLSSIAFLISHGLTSHTWESVGKAALLNAFFIPYLHTDYFQVFVHRIVGAVFPINNPAWSLFFGLLANFLYAISVRRTNRAPLAWVAAAAVGLFVALLAYGQAPGWGTENFLGGFPRVLFCFFAGVLVFQWRDRIRLPAIHPALLVAAIVAILLVPRFSLHATYWLFSVLVVVPLLVALGSRCAVGRGSIAHHACVFSGRISYPLFCLHYPLLIWISKTPTQGSRIFWILGWYLVASIVLAFVATKYYEEPLRAWLTARFGPE